MLIECPGCRQQMSEQATICPNCGRPLSDDERTRATKEAESRRTMQGCALGCLTIVVIIIILAIVTSGTRDTPDASYESGTQYQRDVEADAQREIERDKERRARLQHELDVQIEKQRILEQEGKGQ